MRPRATTALAACVTIALATSAALLLSPPRAASVRAAAAATVDETMATVDDAAAPDTVDPIDGFTPAGSCRQRALEARFLSVPSPEGAASTARWLSAAPHVAGTPRQARLADSLAGRLRSLGFEVEVQRFDIGLPYPETLSLELVAPRRRTLGLREGGGTRGPHLWTWNAYSADGRARAPVVYANYGRAEDFRALDRAGVSVEGRIVLARYGVTYRGAKVREAEERGAAGVVLYPDPADGGFADGDTLPHGPYRPTGSAQRGTVSYLWRHPGDPFTPGWAARPGATGLARTEAVNLPGIPTLNVTAARALPILEALGGPRGPERFRGGWPVPYRLGPGPAVLEMSVRQEYRRRPVRNVLARIPGREERSVLLGNHYDAWVRGGVDPHSGTAALMEVARGLSALLREGWRPRRSIVLAFWDAEEFGAAGSTEFVEARRRWLEEHAVAYFNVDVFTAGTLDVSGSPSLRDLVWSAASAVDDPLGEGTLADGWAARTESPGTRPALGPLGVGSDWTAFFHHAGVPSLQWTMNGRGTYAVYHSALDDFGYLRSHADSALLHAPALAGVMGVAALRLAEAAALPFDYVRYADRVEALVDSLAGDPLPREQASSLRAAVEAFRRAASQARQRRDRALARGDTSGLGRLDRALPRVEGALTREPPRAAAAGEGAAVGPEAAPGAPSPGSWYRHLIWGSDRRTGYGALPLPSLQPRRATGGPDGAPPVEALEQALRRAADLLRDATRPGG